MKWNEAHFMYPMEFSIVYAEDEKTDLRLLIKIIRSAYHKDLKMRRKKCIFSFNLYLIISIIMKSRLNDKQSFLYVLFVGFDCNESCRLQAFDTLGFLKLNSIEFFLCVARNKNWDWDYHFLIIWFRST